MTQSFAVVIEQADHNFSAYVPDLPGCVATGSSRADVLAEIREAIAIHLDGLAADAQPHQRTRRLSLGRTAGPPPRKATGCAEPPALRSPG